MPLLQDAVNTVVVKQLGAKKYIMWRIYVIFLIFCISCNEINKKDVSNMFIEECDTIQINNLHLLCKIWGFMKYYHPDIANGMYDWDNELFEIIPRVVNIKNKKERNRVLSKWIKKIKNPTSVNKMLLDSLMPNVKSYPDILWIEDKEELEEVSDLLLKIKYLERRCSDLDVEGMIYKNYCYLEYSKDSTALFFRNENDYKELKEVKGEYSLLSLFRIWNVIQYYYPYKYLINKKWDDVLFEYIHEFVSVKNILEYKLLISRVLAEVGDTHMNFIDNDIQNWIGNKTVPVDVDFVEEYFVVTGIYDKYYKKIPLKIGDAILKIDGKSVKDIIEEKREYISASNKAALMRKISLQLLYTDKEKLQIEYLRDRQILSDSLETHYYKNVRKDHNRTSSKPLFEYLDENIGYIYLKTIFGGKIPDTIHSKGLIIDLRGYPNFVFSKEYLEFYYLYNESKESVLFAFGNSTWPGLFTYEYTTIAGKDNENYYKGLVIILVNEWTQSHGEYMAMRYRCAPNSIILGSTTAGADGGVVELALPGGLYIPIGIQGVYYPDGRETQRVGIVPDIEVKPTIKGIRERRDEVLEKAIELINEIPE